MLANLLVLGFVIFMAYWWGNRGLFSALLHLLSTIIAGALAFALWEPITMGMLLRTIPPHAWGVGLVAPFVLLLLIVRTAFDKGIKGNLHVHGLSNLLGGGLCGFLSGILAAGILMLGLGQMSLGATVGGWQPYITGSDGNVVDNPPGNLWIRVDQHAANFFSRLSNGAFYPGLGDNGTPLKFYRPDLARQAGIFRMHSDQYASLVAMPGSVNVTAAVASPTPFRNIDDSLLPAIQNDVRIADHMILGVDTHWTLTPGTYDGDSTLRVTSTQAQLITRPQGDPRGPRKMYRALGAARRYGGNETDRQFVPFTTDKRQVSATNPEDDIAFFFIYPANEEPLFVQIRQLRFPLTAPAEEPEQLATLFGKLRPDLVTAYAAAGAVPSDGGGDGSAGATASADGNVGDRQGIKTGSVAVAIESTNKLPAQFSRNVKRNLDVQGKTIMGGEAEIPLSRERISPANVIDEVNKPGHRGIVRVQVDRDAAQSLLGRSRTLAAMTQPIYLTDDSATRWEPVGYAWMRGDKITIRFDPAQPLRAASELPIADMRQGEQLYLYFYVNPGSKIVAYNVGSTKQDVDLDVPK